MARYLVTGASGFVGRHLVPQLRSEGHEVVALVRRDNEHLRAAGAELRFGDVLDAGSVRDAAAGCDGLFHLAGKVSRKPEDAGMLHELHVKGTETAITAAYEAGVRSVVYASTSGVVAVSDDPEKICTEDDDTPIGIIQRWPYYRSKLFAEHKALELGESLDGLRLVCMNPTIVLGPGDLDGSSTGDVKDFLEGKVPAAPPGGLSYIDVRDLAVAFSLGMQKGEGGRRYLLGACNITLKEFIGRMSRISGVDAPLLSMPRIPKLVDATISMVTGASKAYEDLTGADMGLDPESLDMAHFYWYLDATRAETELGWRAREPLETLADTIEDLYARGVIEEKSEPLTRRWEKRGREVWDKLSDSSWGDGGKRPWEELRSRLRR